MNEQTPEWDVMVVDGEPEVMVNLAAIAVMIRDCPLPQDIAVDNIVSRIGEHYRAELTTLVAGGSQ